MRLGIKTGPKSNWYNDLSQTKPEFCEIWFNPSQQDKYVEMLEYARKFDIDIGLHFWGALEDQTLANFIYPNKKTLMESQKLLNQTIEVALKYKAVYVNIHPHGTRLTRVDFEKETFIPYTSSIDTQTALTNLIESLTGPANELFNNGSLLSVESAPLYANGTPWTGPEGRLNPVLIGEMQLNDVLPLYKEPHIYFANDFGHLAAQVVSNQQNEIITYINKFTSTLFSKTKLLHVGFIVPPYNGTDYHGSLYAPDFVTNKAIPNKQHMQQLLKLFKDRPDVLCLVEPEKDHIGNFLALHRLIDSL